MWMPKLDGEKTTSWPKAPPGSRGPRRGVAGFEEVKQAAAQDMADDKGLSGLRVGKKISKLRHEGKPEDQAVAMALNMEREHRLTEGGGYKRKGKY